MIFVITQHREMLLCTGLHLRTALIASVKPSLITVKQHQCASNHIIKREPDVSVLSVLDRIYLRS